MIKQHLNLGFIIHYCCPSGNITLHSTVHLSLLSSNASPERNMLLKSSLTYAKHQVPLLVRNMFAANVFFSFSGLLKGLLREKGRYILIYMNHLLPPTFHFLHTLHLITEKKSFVSLKLYTVNLSFIFSLPQSTLMFRFLGVFKVLCKNLSN